MHLRDTQRDMRRAYVNGGVGIFVSGLVWVIAGTVTSYVDLFSGMATLFFGGMLIHPLSLFLARGVYRRGRARAPNPMEMLTLQSTAFLIIGLAIAYLVSGTYGDAMPWRRWARVTWCFRRSTACAFMFCSGWS